MHQRPRKLCRDVECLLLPKAAVSSSDVSRHGTPRSAGHAALTISLTNPPSRQASPEMPRMRHEHLLRHLPQLLSRHVTSRPHPDPNFSSKNAQIMTSGRLHPALPDCKQTARRQHRQKRLVSTCRGALNLAKQRRSSAWITCPGRKPPRSARPLSLSLLGVFSWRPHLLAVSKLMWRQVFHNPPVLYTALDMYVNSAAR